MDTTELFRYKQLLIAKRNEVLRSQAASGDTSRGGPERPRDVIDQAAAVTEKEVLIRLHQTDWKLLRASDETPARIDQGAFGLCAGCKQPIAKARLDAVPWTHLRRACKEQGSA